MLSQERVILIFIVKNERKKKIIILKNKYLYLSVIYWIMDKSYYWNEQTHQHIPNNSEFSFVVADYNGKQINSLANNNVSLLTILKRMSKYL